MIDYKMLTFLSVVKTRNYTKTAELLHITQPGVSQHIKSLEAYYNVKLFNIKKKSIELTLEGQRLYEYAIEVNRLANTVKNDLENRAGFVKKYNIGATLTIGGYVIPEILGRYKQEHPNVEIMLAVENTETVIKHLITGDMLMGIVEGPFDRTQFQFTKFKDDELILVVSPEHEFASKSSVSIEAVLENKLILREKGSGTRMVFENELVSKGYHLTDDMIYMEIGNINALVSLVESNLGCTIISREAVREHLKSGSLVHVPIQDFGIFREFNFIYFDFDDEFMGPFISFCKKQDE